MNYKVYKTLFVSHLNDHCHLIHVVKHAIGINHYLVKHYVAAFCNCAYRHQYWDQFHSFHSFTKWSLSQNNQNLPMATKGTHDLFRTNSQTGASFLRCSIGYIRFG
ncbi:hypothetical protein ACF0H5_023736 [Mactra antiquata]